MNVDGMTLARLLKQVHLGGLIGECVLYEQPGGVSAVRAVDLTNSVFLDCKAKTNLIGVGNLGLGDLAALCKFLDASAEQLESKLEANRLTFKRSDGSVLRFLLAQPELIPTAIAEEEALQKLLAGCVQQSVLTADVQKSLSFYMGLVKTNSIDMEISSGGDIVFRGGLESEHQFSLESGKSSPAVGPVVKSGKRTKRSKSLPDSQPSVGDGFSIRVYGAHLAAVLSVLEWDNTQEEAIVHFAPQRPVVITQGGNAWALTVISQE